jgi:hypothetical protein
MGRGGGVPLLICVGSKSGSGEARQDCGGVAVGDVRCWRNLRGQVVECRMRSTWSKQACGQHCLRPGSGSLNI